MTKNALGFVWFEPHDCQFRAFLTMEDIITGREDPEVLLNQVAGLYEQAVKGMRSLVAEIQDMRTHRKLVPARKVWQVGDAIFILGKELEKFSLQVDGLYDHLVRDLGVKRKWLEKVVIFRRYLPEQEAIPDSLNWGRCEKGTRRIAEQIRGGMLHS
jgi:hypothetical protein